METLGPIYVNTEILQKFIDRGFVVEGETKSSNPKEAIGGDKLPLHLWPSSATAMGCLGMLDGALKYGRSNYLIDGVKATTYIAAAMRHLALWKEGYQNTSDTNIPHLACALACIAIVVDAQAAGVLNDDRMYPSNYAELVEELTPYVKQLKEQHAKRVCKHYTIADKK